MNYQDLPQELRYTFTEMEKRGGGICPYCHGKAIVGEGGKVYCSQESCSYVMQQNGEQ
jgi:hypothetical protein